MQVISVDAWSKPLPDPDGTERPFFEAAAEGRLTFQECTACGHRQFYPRPLCTACGGEVRWVDASGRGEVYTFTVVRQFHAKPFKDELPYVVAMIELEEGVKMFGGITDCAPDGVQVGMSVEAYAVKVEDGLAIPFWRPA